MKDCYAAVLAGVATLCLLSSVAAQTSSYLSTVSAGCPLDCQGDAVCVQGEIDFGDLVSIEQQVPWMKAIESRGYYCQCRSGRTGLLCEREYETCGDGSHVCFHGGKCVSGLKDSFGNGQHYCDCSDATHDGKDYAGKYCEAEAIDTCGSTVESGLVFCTNGGTCRNNFLDHLDQPCTCPQDVEGPHCEYQKGQVPGCDLMCENGGHCRIGSKEYPQHEAYTEFWQTHEDNRYCVCKPGYFGLRCEIQGKRCGTEHCFNGAECISHDLGDGTTQEFCDCTTAKDRGSSFAGSRCESESTSYCTQLPDHNGHQFCVNGGQCRLDSHLGCDCLEGFNGPICEFRDTDAGTQATECNLECKHNGVCRNGAKDVSFLKKFNVDIPDLYSTASNQFEHCVCPKGYVGLQCEHMVDVCPGGESICMNGATCIPDDSDGRLKFRCDCGSIHTEFHKYAGDFCELRSTDLCTRDRLPGVGLNKDAFCVNGGQCRDRVGEDQGHPGCTCPTGFEGDRCEHLSAERQNDSEKKSKQTSDGGMPAAAIIPLVIFVIIGLFMSLYYYQRHQSSIERIDPGEMNLMALDYPKAPTLGDVASMGSMHECSERSNLDISRHSHRSHIIDDECSGVFNFDDKKEDLVNVAII